MPIPYREWSIFQHFSAQLQSPDASDDREHWLAGRLEWGQAGRWRNNAGTINGEWKTVVRPLNGFDYDPTNLNLLVDIEIDVLISPKSIVGASTHFHWDFGAQANPLSPGPATWDRLLADGVFYDGINYWCLLAETPFYPTGNAWSTHLDQVDIPVLLTNRRGYGCSYKTGLGPEIWMNKWSYEYNGIELSITNYTAPFAPGDSCLVNMSLKRLRFLYLNPVVNSLSRYSMPAAGGVPLVFSGLGFNNIDTEVSDTTKNSSNSVPPAGGWNDTVYHIEFRGLQGQPTITLHEHLGDFVVNDNTTMTIAAMPAMAEGSYEIYLIKNKANLGGAFPGFGPGYAYAGDWRCKADGRLYPGTRLTFTVGIPGPGKKKPTVFSKWRFKKYGGGIDRNYAPIDTVSPAVFYDGRILAMSTLTRAISDKGGLYTSSDMDIELANPDKEFSKLLAEYFLKNQIVKLFYGWADQPESWKTGASVLIVDDYSRPGSVFKVRLRDITTKYFKRKIPLYRVNLAEYPNAHKNILNKPMPEVLGNADYSIAGQGGAVEALCVDTINYKWLAARGSLQEITAVYIDGGLCTAGPLYYTITYDDGGRTYININPVLCDTDAKITFNAKGYSYAAWDSAGGFVQNPAYILGFFLGFLLEVPEDFLDFDSLDALAAKFTADGEGTSGFLVLQGEQDSETITEELLFTMGAQSAFDRSGRFYVERKDLSVLGTSLFIFSQIDTLDHPDFNHNLKSAINRMRYRWTYSPAGDTYAGGAEATRQSSITDFEQELESADFIDFKWTTSSAWAAKRAEEELLKWGYGQPQISFDLPLAWIDDLDILTNFRLQDPFGLSRIGAGEIGRYCYVTSFSADFLGARLSIQAMDLSWILRQYLICGDENTLPANWANATDEERIWAFACEELTGRFADGEPGKKAADENMV